MKIAIVHDWLNQKVGGAESVLFELADMYPKADIYTIIYNPKKFDYRLKNRNIIKSWLQFMPGFIKKRPKLLLPFVKSAVTRWDFEGYDLVISSSSAWVKNIIVPQKTRHICYCHTPARMLWDSWPGYIDDMRIGPILRFYLVRLASKLRLWDYYQSQTRIEFVANSQYIAKRINKFYHKSAKVVYPPVDTDSMNTASSSSKNYYLVLSVLSKYKNIDLAVQAFKSNDKNLVVAGDGPEIDNLKSLAKGHNNIQFVGRVEDSKKSELMQEARGFIFCSIEDFGITMVESIASNTPVIALKGGGALEIIKEGNTGMFFDSPTVESLSSAISKYERTFGSKHKIDNNYIFSEFSKAKFEKNIREIVGE